jgi:hypothetical protein
LKRCDHRRDAPEPLSITPSEIDAGAAFEPFQWGFATIATGSTPGNRSDGAGACSGLVPSAFCPSKHLEGLSDLCKPGGREIRSRCAAACKHVSSLGADELKFCSASVEAPRAAQ